MPKDVWVFFITPDWVLNTGESDRSARYSIRQMNASVGFSSSVPVISFSFAQPS